MLSISCSLCLATPRALQGSEPSNAVEGAIRHLHTLLRVRRELEAGTVAEWWVCPSCEKYQPPASHSYAQHISRDDVSGSCCQGELDR